MHSCIIFNQFLLIVTFTDKKDKFLPPDDYNEKKGSVNMWRNQTSHILFALSIKTKYILNTYL